MNSSMEYYRSIDPFRHELLAERELDTDESLALKIKIADSLSPYSVEFNSTARKRSLILLGSLLIRDRDSLASMISQEVGKPIKESVAEIEKCVALCDYYSQSFEEVLKDEELVMGPDRAIRRYEALGNILGIMPWNFPFWQVFRFAIPTILSGNRVLLKHAPNCLLTANALKGLFDESGLGKAYQDIYLTNEQVSLLIKNPKIKGLSVTGSTRAGRELAQQAAQALKPQLLELGGSNAFLIHKSARPGSAAKLASKARLLNAGQSCIAAKRFLVPKEMETEFLKELKLVFESYKMGDPLMADSDIGPLARKDLKDLALDQWKRSINAGSEPIKELQAEGNFIAPSILKVNNLKAPVFTEEVFAPIASVYAYTDWEEAVRISNSSQFGLGISLVGEDIDFLLEEAARFEEGAVFINELVKSDPRLPFGGVKNSGYGRELGPEGLKSFTNLKTIYLKQSLENVEQKED